MKKKLSLLLCLVCSVSTLTACGADPKSVDYYGTTYEELEATAEGFVSDLSSMTDDQLEQYSAAFGQTEGYEIVAKLIDSWTVAKEGLGEYQGLGELTIAKANGTVTVDQCVDFANRDMMVSYVYTYDYAEEQLIMTDANADIVYTLGEKMTKAGLNTLMGMGTVFVVLILISLIIYCFNLIPYLTERKNKKKAATEVADISAPVAQEEVALTDDLELIAVISAAIAASEGTSTDSFVVRSINRR